jgi:hypothetical protein
VRQSTKINLAQAILAVASEHGAELTLQELVRAYAAPTSMTLTFG